MSDSDTQQSQNDEINQNQASSPREPSANLTDSPQEQSLKQQVDAKLDALSQDDADAGAKAQADLFTEEDVLASDVQEVVSDLNPADKNSDGKRFDLREAGKDIAESVQAAGATLVDGFTSGISSSHDAFEADMNDFREFIHDEAQDIKEFGHEITHPKDLAEHIKDDVEDIGKKVETIGKDVAHPAETVRELKEKAAQWKVKEATNDQTKAEAELGAKPFDQKKLPVFLKILGVLLIIGAFVLAIPLTYTAVQAAELWAGNRTSQQFTASTVLAIVQMVTLMATAITDLVLGIRILRRKRRYAALTINALYVLMFVNILCSIMLHGITAVLIPDGVVIIVLIAVQSYLDPSLAGERELRRKLRDMENREEAEEGTLGLDTEGPGYIRLNFFNLFWIFVVCSILGLIIETIFHAILFGDYQDRAGMLFGPFSPIYGFGAVLMTVFLNRLHDRNVIIIFFISAIIGGAFEYFTSWFMQYAYGAVAWNYTGMWLSIGGRTCGLFMAMWGLLGVVWIKLLLPVLLRVVNLIPWNWRYGVTVIAAALMLIDGMMTLQALDCWYQRLSGEQPDSPVQVFYEDHFDNSYMANRFQSMTIHPSDATRVKS